MTQAAIEALLKEKIGLDAQTLGPSTIARTIAQRMADGNFSDIVIYYQRLQSSPQELQELIESVIVPETWFFRNQAAFTCLSKYVMSEWLPTHPNGILRVLSIPCSTGEEPYSIAIALMQAGLAPKKFSIEAVDISKEALLKAQRAIYAKNSFRGTDLALQETYFQQREDGYQLREIISSKVKFIHGNLLDSSFLVNKFSYDIIFCRNVLIYFDNSAKDQALQILQSLLVEKGLLFVGAGENGPLLASWFVPMQYPQAFAYHKGGERQSLKPLANPVPKPTTFLPAKEQNSLKKSPSYNSKISQSPKQPPLTPSPNPLPPPSLPQPTLLETAKILADRGKLEEATTLCETYLSQNRSSAEAYNLLGQVLQASNRDEQAEQCFQKALYLEPNHSEALLHLALIKEQRGDMANATILYQRIQRLKISQ